MAEPKIPNALEMRDIKYGEASDEARTGLAAALRAAGRRAEAVLLHERQPDHPALREEAEWAVRTGGGFHLLAVQRAGRTVQEDEFRACAAAAEGHGRWMDARLCYQAIGAADELARIAEHLPPSLQEPEEAGDDA